MSENIKITHNNNKKNDENIVNNYEKITIKILIVGEPGVGKSNFISRFIDNKFMSTNLSTVCFNSNYKTLNFGNKNIIVQLWDSAGKFAYKSITQSLFNRVHGIIILYDITNLKSFKYVEKWINFIEEENKKIIYNIAGNKCDLNESRQVDENEGKKLGNKYGINFIETSAKMNINITECINNLVKKIIDCVELENNPTFALDERSYKFKGKATNERCC